MVGAENKHTFKIFISITNHGELLPIQAIHKGQNEKSLPSLTSQSQFKLEKAGFLFELSKMATYWSTITTMQNFVNVTLAPYFDSMWEKLRLANDQMAWWLIDCWSIHHSQEFLGWMALKHSLTIIIFIPTGLTGLFQPCDVSLEHIFMDSLKKSAHKDVVHEVLDQLKAGCTVHDIKIDTGIKVLRD